MVLHHDADDALDLLEHAIAVVLCALGNELGEGGRFGETVDGGGPHLDVAALFDQGFGHPCSVMAARFDCVGRCAEELEQFLDAACRQPLAEEEAAGDRVGAHDIALLVGLVAVREKHRELDERVDPPVEFDAVDTVSSAGALDDLRAREAVVDVALAEGADDALGVAEKRRLVDDGAAVGGDGSGHGAESARAAASPMALPHEVELVVAHLSEDTQAV